MANVIAVLVLAVLVGSASAYIVKAKKSGVKCIGCPAGGSCPGSAQTSEKEAGRTGDWQKNNENIRDALCALRRGCGKNTESD